MPLLLSGSLIFFLVFLNGFFVAAQFAMVKVRGSRIDYLVSEGGRRAKFAAHLTRDLDGYLFACQLGITLASLGLGYVGEPAIASIIEPYLKDWFNLSDGIIHTIAFLTAFFVIIILHIVLGVLAPQTLAIRKAESVTLLTAAPLMLFHNLMYPFIIFLNATGNRLLKLFGLERVSESESGHTEEEIRIMVKESHKSGLIDNTELTLVDNIFEFAETSAREIKIPRTDMVCLYTNLTFQDNKEIALREMHTRFPVCDEHKDNIIGFVHIKDILKVDEKSIFSITQITRPVTTVPETMQISTLLKLLQKKKTQIAILIDEYGGTSGLVTLEDIMEEIVGEIQDEFDDERPDIEKIDDDHYSINGQMLIEEVNSFFSLDIEYDEYDTIGGWIYSQIEIPPKKLETVSYMDTHDFIIEETDNLRISRIIVRKRQPIDGPVELPQAETG
ncbi:hemolysin family protein [Paenibacillus abyssi]|uniref:hemolysin family protein n=1 Tax=Paenibacillus abyssi TaxID=1340531 RepID=UPI00166B470A|nr:hemolysin family protein [Paenibacillus abyssi]